MPVRLGNDSIEIIYPDKTYVVDTIKSTGERDGDTVVNVPVVSYTTTQLLQQQAESNTGVNGWRLVRFLPPTSSTWYSGNHFTSTNMEVSASLGTAYDYDNEFMVPFGTYDEIMFSTRNMQYWMHILKSNILGNYSDQPIDVISSSINPNNHTVPQQYNRSGVNVDPIITLTGYNANPRIKLYLESSNGSVDTTLTDNGGMCVFVRSSTDTISRSLVPAIPLPDVSYPTHKILTFTHDGSANNQTEYTVNFPENTTCDILIVGGGGGGGGANGGGGGGAGGLVFYPNIILNTNITIKVGKGGNKGAYNVNGDNGKDSSIIINSNTISAVGGGGGGQGSNKNGLDGGSGGGMRHNNSGTQSSSTQSTGTDELWKGYGNKGGFNIGNISTSGGGGGAGEMGYNNYGHKDTTTTTDNGALKGRGGDGLNEVIINGIIYNFKQLFGDVYGEKYNDEIYFAGGGGGSAANGDSFICKGGYGGGASSASGNNNGNDGLPNTGGGGSGGNNGNVSASGGNGGSGIVIIRYKQQYNQVPFNAQWTYSAADTSVHHYGNVGIGTTASDTTKLAIRGDVNVIGDYYKNNETFGQWYKNSISGVSIYRHSGNVGVGTSNPGYSLDVMGNVYASEGGISGNGSTSWITTSDSRIKENIVRASYKECYEIFKKINLYRYNYNGEYIDTNDKNQLGFIAQEVKTYLPDSVQERKMKFKNGVYIDDTLTLNVTEINYVMFGAFKYLMGELEIIKKYLPEPIVQDTVVDTNTDTIEDTTLETNTDTIEDTTIETNTDTIEDTTLETNTDTIEDTTLETNTGTIEDTTLETNTDTIEDTTLETNTGTIQDTTIETNTDTIEDTTIETNTGTIQDTTLETNTDTI